MTRIVLIRHATTDSVGIKLSGRTAGVILNKEGLEQARQLTARLSNIKVDAIFSSPMERALQTVEPLCIEKHLQVQTSENFNEIDFGEWTNKSIDSLKNDKTFQHFNSSRSITRIPGGEIITEAQDRIVSGLKKISEEYFNQTCIVVSHSDMIKSAVCYFLGIHLDNMHRIEISPCSVTVIELFTDTTRMMLMNHTGDIKM